MLKAGLATQTEGPGATGLHGTKAVHPPPSPAEIASLFPQLEILECLGRGGMGVVYKARQPRLNRLVALKILARDKEQDAQFAERFTREAQALARLSHPNIVTVHDFGQVGQASSLPPSAKQNEKPETGKMPVPLCYLVMEFVDGLSLRQLLQTGKMKPEQALTIVPKICEALQYAHEQGIVHRDIKPENILLDKQGRVKIADFGIAKMVGVEAGQQTLTGAKDMMGTPHYMAPEQIEKPQTVDHRADIYSLGVLFYEMLTGELPLGKFQPPSKKVQIDVRLDEVVLHALEKEPERRYQQASQVKTAVETIAADAVKCEVLPQGGTKPEVETIRRQVKAPAIGLVIVGALNWVLFALFFMAYGLKLAGSMGLAPQIDVPAVVLLIPLLAMALNGFIIYGALKVMRLERWGVGIVASVLAMIVAPANIIGLPIGVWALVVLNRPDVRGVFKANRSRSKPMDARAGIIGSPRFSLSSVVGAAWTPFFLAAILSITLGQEQFPQAYGSLSRVLLFLGLAAPVATTILGWLAVAQVRRSTGRFHGLELAVFDGLFFPLLGVDVLIGIFWLILAKTSAHWRGLDGSLFYNLWEFALWTLLLIAICAAFDFLIARYVWRRMNQPFKGANTPTRTRWTRTILSALMGGLLSVGVISFIATSLALCCRNVDNVNRPFVDDPQIIGHWTYIDFVSSPDDFKPGAQTWKGDLSVFKNFTVFPDGRTSYRWLTWTKGAMINKGEKTAGDYQIRNFDGTNYLFVEWKNGDYILFHSNPWFFVLRQTEEANPNFSIGQAWFPKGDSIEITSVERTPKRMVVKGHYHLVSHNNALLALYITTTNKNVSEGSGEGRPISKGSGDFTLVYLPPVSGLPHVSMYADGHSFASLYFGTKAEALAERKASWITNNLPSSTLQFRLVLPKDSSAPGDWLPSVLGPNRFHLSRQVLLDDADITQAGVDFNPDGRRKIEVRFTDAGAKKFEAITATNVGRQLAIVFRGRVLSAPVIQSVIPSGGCQVDGSMNGSDIHQIVDCLNRTAIPTTTAWNFSPVHERILPFKPLPDALFGWLDLDSGTVLTNSSLDLESHSGYEWIRTNGLDVVTTDSAKHFPTLLGVDMLVAPAPTNGWEIVTAADVVNNWALLQQEPQSKTVVGVLPGQTDTFFFQTREGGKGIMQILGFANNPPGVEIRYKLAENASAATETAQTFAEQPPAVVETRAVSEAQKWLALIDGGHYSESWKQASAIVRGAVTEQGFANSMETFRKPLGNLLSRKVKSAQPMTELPGAPDGQYVVMQFETSFANKKTAIETVTFMLDQDGQWKSAGYFIK
jgi:hypothetical protein